MVLLPDKLPVIFLKSLVLPFTNQQTSVILKYCLQQLYKTNVANTEKHSGYSSAWLLHITSGNQCHIRCRSTSAAISAICPYFCFIIKYFYDTKTKDKLCNWSSLFYILIKTHTVINNFNFLLYFFCISLFLSFQ